MLGGNEDVEIISNNTENLQEALNDANFGNIRAEDYVNIDVDVTTEADLNDINHFIEDHQQAEEQDQELESEEESSIAESSVKTYSDALKHLKYLENFALTRNDSDLFQTIFRARMIAERHAYKSIGYIQKTLFNYSKKGTVISVIKHFVLSACIVFSDCFFFCDSVTN
jgi:glycyl-tRNA synthetase beta subunit